MATKRSMRWRFKDGAWWYGDGRIFPYKTAQVGGKWDIYFKGRLIKTVDQLDDAKHFIPRDYVEKAIR